jgi:hypothetical protein
MKANTFEIFFSHLQSPSGFSQIHHFPLFVVSHKAEVTARKFSDFGGIATQPAGFVQANRLVSASRAVLVQQAELYDIKLERTR